VASLRHTLAFFFVAALTGCVAPWLQEPLRENKELNSVLDAYKKQNAEITARRGALASQGIRLLTIAKSAGSDEPLVTLDVDRAPLPIVIGRIFHEAGVSYVVEPGLLRGVVTGRLTNVALLPAVNALLAHLSLIAGMRDKVVVIKEAESDEPTAAQPREAQKVVTGKTVTEVRDTPLPAAAASTRGDKPPAPPSAPAKPQPKPVVTKEVPLTYLDPPAATAFLEGVAKKAASESDPGLQFSLQPYTSTVFLAGSADNVSRAAKALRAADRDPAHVIIEVLVVGFDAETEEDLGTDLKNLTTRSGTGFMTGFGSTTDKAFTYLTGVKNPRSVKAEIDLLVSRKKARIIARPYLATVSGRKANIAITKDQYLIVQQAVSGAAIAVPQAVETGVKLEIVPHVAGDGKVRMDVTVEQSQFVEQASENVAAEVAKNLAHTTMELESGQAILIGGMSQYVSATSSSGLPWLRHVPILNIFFAKFEADSHRQEILVYLVPYIVWSPELTSPIPDADAFGPKEPRDLFTAIETGGK
jgi:type II/III secretion system protein